MKPSYEWDENDVLSLIDNQIEESLYLDYKSCDALRPSQSKSKDKIIEELSKDISAFANADGGTIVYGVTEDKHKAIYVDEHPFSPGEITKEWLENIIDSNIKRKIEGVKIKPIELTQKNPGKLIYAIYIPQSLQGAHQAKDKRYYQRRNFKAEPMEDYQIRDVMNRFKSPILEPKFMFYGSGPNTIGMKLSIVNTGNVTATNYGIDILLPSYFKQYMNNDVGLALNGMGEQIIKINIIKESWKISYRNTPFQSVLFPTEIKDIFDQDQKLFHFREDAGNLAVLKRTTFEWKLFADNMIPKSGEKPIFTED